MRPMFLDLFGGAGGVSKHVRKLGFPAILFDTCHGPHCNIVDDKVFHLLCGWISSGQVSGMFAHTPCNGMSRARRAPQWSRMPHQLRSMEHPAGLPALSDTDRQTLQLSNQIADRTAHLLHLAIARGIPAGEENPSSSYLWAQSSRIELAKLAADDVTFDFCSFHKPFRARTRMMFWNVKMPALGNRLCKARGHVCSFSGKPHQQLTGFYGNTFATLQKQQYPPGLCNILATALSSGWTRQHASSIWQAMHCQPSVLRSG